MPHFPALIRFSALTSFSSSQPVSRWLLSCRAGGPSPGEIRGHDTYPRLLFQLESGRRDKKRDQGTYAALRGLADRKRRRFRGQVSCRQTRRSLSPEPISYFLGLHWRSDGSSIVRSHNPRLIRSRDARRCLLCVSRFGYSTCDDGDARAPAAHGSIVRALVCWEVNHLPF